MKRSLKVVLFVVGLAAILVGGVWFTAFSHNSPIVDGEVLPGVASVKDAFVSVDMVDVAPGKVALVDCGNDGDAKAVKGALTKRGMTPDAVVAVFLTHGHGDHTAGCKQFGKADVYAMANEVELVGDAAKVSHPLKDGEVVTVGDVKVEAFAVPGHTAGSAVYLARGALFFGDSAGASSEGRVMKAVSLFSKSSAENVASLKALTARLEPRKAEIKELVFAHTGPLAGFEPLEAFARQP